MQSTTAQQLVTQLQHLGITDDRVLAAIANVPRQYFVDEAIAHQAWEIV